MDWTNIGTIGNYYGGLIVAKKDGKYYWLIVNYNTNYDDVEEYEEIPKSLYDSLMRFQKKK